MRSVRGRWLALGVAAISLAGSTRSDGATFQREQVEISAPLLPDVLMLYQPFPTTLDGEKALAENGVYTYDQLLNECAATYPAITLTPLSSADIATNYDTVAECAHDAHNAKPYWTPKLIADVDLCGSKLGAGWRLISEDDLATFVDNDYQFIHDTLAGVGDPNTWGPLYFGLTVWLRAHDGTIGVGTLEPGVAAGQRITMRNLDAGTEALQLPIALRCIRRTDLP
jgi:hypothetical protein